MTSCCIVGCGAISELYYGPLLAELASNSDLVVSAVFDPNPARLDKLSQLFPKAERVTEFGRIIKLQPNAAIVASPPRYHAEQTIALLNAGIAVLCEKPMAATVSEAEAMSEASEKHRIPLAIGLFRRFFPVNDTIREIVRLKSLGPVKSFEVSEGDPFQWPAQSASLFQKESSQGGVLADLGVHVLDILLWWFGAPVQIEYEDDAMGGLEANCLVRLWFNEGIHGSVRLSRDTQLPNRTIIQFEQAWLRCQAASTDKLDIGFNGVAHSCAGRLETLGPRGPQAESSVRAITYHQSFARQLIQFITAVRGEEPVFVSGADGIKSMRVIESCYRNRKLMSMPWLSTEEQATATKLAACEVPI